MLISFALAVSLIIFNMHILVARPGVTDAESGYLWPCEAEIGVFPA